jgi:hypothetical protein
MDLNCGHESIECVALDGSMRGDVEDAVDGAASNGSTMNDGVFDVTCADIASTLQAAMPVDDINTFSYPDPPPEGWGILGGAGISLHYNYLTGAGTADILWMLLHEARHNLGQDHVGEDFDPDDSDDAFGLCSTL